MTKQKIITTLYNANVEVPVTVSINEPCDRDTVYDDQTFYDLDSANNYMNNKEYNLDKMLDEKRDYVEEDMSIEVLVDEEQEIEKSVSTKLVNDLTDYEISRFLKRNPEFVLAQQQVITSFNEDNLQVLNTRETRKVFVEKQVDQKEIDLGEVS